MVQPRTAAMKKVQAETRYVTPIQKISVPVSLFNTEDGENNKIAPPQRHPTVGRVNHAGTLASFDLCTIGVEITPPNTFSVKSN
jgi:hypothetical protein